MKLVNGDEVVSEVMETNHDYYVIKRPCTVVPSAQGMGLMQSLFVGQPDHLITIHKQHIMLMAPVVKDMETHYLSTTSGIKLARA